MGAWIEILDVKPYLVATNVAPHMGAWIEINNDEIGEPEPLTSHPTWVRGLK